MKEVNIVSTIVGRGSDKQTTSKAPSMGAYALKSDVTALQSLFNDFLEGDDTDNVINKWNEVESFLNGISEDNTLTSILGDYIPIKGYTEILGEKNFTGGIKVNGKPIVYDSRGFWKLEGDLLVTGGVSMYSSDTEFTPSTIMDAIVVDNVTIIKQDGKLVALGGGGTGGGGIADSVVWGNVLGKPAWITDSAPSINVSGVNVSLGGSITQSALRTALGLGSNAYSSTAYLPLTGGTLTGNLSLQYANPRIIFKDAEGTTLGSFGLNNDVLSYYKTADTKWYTIYHSGNFTPSNYLPLTGGTLNGVLTLNYADTKSTSYIIQTNGRAVVNGGGWAIKMYSMTNKDGDVLTQIGAYGVSEELKYLYIGSNGYDGECLRIYPTHVAFGNSQIALLNSNVASATKLQTARTIWGQSFDGTGNVDGSIIMKNNSAFVTKDTGGTNRTLIHLNDSNSFSIGYGSAAAGYNTYIDGNNIYFRTGTSHTIGLTLNSVGQLIIAKDVHMNNNMGIGFNDTGGTNRYNLIMGTDNVLRLGAGQASAGYLTYILGKQVQLRYGTSHTLGFILNDSGNITIGSSDLASTNYKLYVNGRVHIPSPITGFTNALHGGGYGLYQGNYYSSALTDKDTAINGDKIILSPTSNVGIGTTSPAAKLHVSGTAYASKFLMSGTTGYITGIARSWTDTYNDAASNARPWCGLSVVPGQNTYEEMTLANYYGMLFKTGGSSFPYIFMGGKIGVGTATPTERLHVNGNILATGGVTTNDSMTINGIKLYKSQDGVLYLDGNLVVRGGVTMYGSDSESAPGILDSLPIASTTAKGIAQFSSAHFTVTDGIVSIIGSNVGLNQTELESYLTTNKYAKKSDIPTIPTSLKNPYSLTFGSKTYDGSAARTIVASDLGALTSHQSIYALTIKNSAGTTQLTYTPNSSTGSLTLTKSMVGLGNVENTALSTWVGTSKITTLGTITSGTWNGTKIANTYLANSSITISGTSVSLGGSITQSALRTALGLGSNAYSSTAYLPLTGGTISSSSSDAITINTSSKNGVGISYKMSDSQVCWIGYDGSRGACLYNSASKTYFSVKDDGSLYYNNGTIWHSGNFTPSNYLPLTGGTLSDYTETPLILKGTYSDNVLFHLHNKSNIATSIGKYGEYTFLANYANGNGTGELEIHDDGRLTYATGGNNYSIWHEGNDGSGSGLDADLLDGIHARQFTRTIHTNNTANSYVKILRFTRTNDKGWLRLSVNESNSNKSGASGEFIIEWSYIESTTSTRDIAIKCLYSRFDIAKNLTAVRVDFNTFDLYWTTSAWCRTAFTLIDYAQTCTIDDFTPTALSTLPTATYTSSLSNNMYINASSATKLATARTIWGQSFDGTGNVDGSIISSNRAFNIFANTSKEILSYSTTSKYLSIGYGTLASSFTTYIHGYNINLRYGASGTDGLILNSSGNITIGSSDLASTNYKLYVNGLTKIASSTNIGLQIDSSYNGAVTRGVQVLNPSMPLGDANGVALLFGQSTSAYNCGNIAYRHHGENNTNNYVGIGLYGKDNILVCKANGNVGIDSLNPTAKLHVSGNILATGGVTMESARKLKNIQDERGLSLEELAVIKPTRFTWKDNRDEKIHIGGIADDVMKVLPEVIYKTEDDTLTMDYGNAAFAISASLINPVINHEEEIRILKERIKELEEKVKVLTWNIA